MKELTWLDDLKLRASWGQTGNQEISNLARYTIYAPNYGTTDSFGGQSYGTAYDITGSNGGGTLPSGFKRNQIGNDNIKWETTTADERRHRLQPVQAITVRFTGILLQENNRYPD